MTKKKAKKGLKGFPGSPEYYYQTATIKTMQHKYVGHVFFFFYS